MKGTRDEIADLLEHDLIHTQAVWWKSLSGILEIADVPDEREEHEKFSDRYLLEHFLHHWRVGRRRRTEEANLTKVVRKHKCEQDLAKRNWAACQHSFDCGTNFIAVLFPLINIPQEKALYRERLIEIYQGIAGFKAARDVAANKVDAAKSDLDAYQIPRDIEHNCRQCNLNKAFYTLQEWISKNPLTEDGGQMSYYYDVTGPDDQEFKYIAKFDPDKRPGGFGSEAYALFHGWEVGPHAVASGQTSRNYFWRTSMDPFPNPLNVVPERGVWV